MERLHGLDAGFLYMETPTQHMHTLKIAIVDPADAPGGYTFDRVRALLGERLPLLTPFTRTLVRVPAGLHHPLWRTTEVDLTRHVHRVELPAPGRLREVEDAVSWIAAQPLDRSLPLWELWVLEGVEGGRVAFVAKIHHAVADGVAAATLLARVTDPATEPDTARATAGHADEPEPAPRPAEVVAAAVRERLRGLRDLPRLLAETIRRLVDVLRWRRGASAVPPRPILDTPRTRFNAALTPRRNFATTTLSFDAIRAVKDDHNVSVNDVVLAVVGGALRAYLDARGELPRRSLVAAVPTAADDLSAAVDRDTGNDVSAFFTTLATDLDDPAERLHRIHAGARAAKTQQDLFHADLLGKWAAHSPPGPYAWGARLYSTLRLADRHAPAVNLVVSNVPGPREVLSVAGARLDEFYSVGPILEGVGLNVTVWSYRGRLQVSLLSCPDLLPDLRDLAARFGPALDDLAGGAPDDLAANGPH